MKHFKEEGLCQHQKRCGGRKTTLNRYPWTIPTVSTASLRIMQKTTLLVFLAGFQDSEGTTSCCWPQQLPATSRNECSLESCEVAGTLFLCLDQKLSKISVCFLAQIHTHTHPHTLAHTHTHTHTHSHTHTHTHTHAHTHARTHTLTHTRTQAQV